MYNVPRPRLMCVLHNNSVLFSHVVTNSIKTKSLRILQFPPGVVAQMHATYMVAV